MERIYTLYLQGYGTLTMIEKCETVFYKEIILNNEVS